MSDHQPDESNKRAQKIDGSWLVIGVGLGSAMGVALKNIALGVGIGIAVGALIGAIKKRRE
jgi:F0F1-type ATP synthase membrane subunit c/vacuolar-type H+-ATPase subunit K